ncbi:MAG: hypothetical protein M3Y28_01090 [Armatimonadota bacterium]|nr:hypothetical protein [Armatimonadota bacterium]
MKSSVGEIHETTSTDATSTPPADAPRSLWRAVALGLLAMPLCCFWAQAQPDDRIFSLMVPPLVLLLVLLVLNIFLRRYAPRWALTQGELLVFYGMQTVACAMASEWIDDITPYIYSYGLFPDRDRRANVLPYLNHWLFFTSDLGWDDFKTGGKSFDYFWAHLGPWWPKIAAWTGLVSLISLAMLCINALMLEQWTERERLSFPLVQLPLAMTEKGGASPIWRSPILWLAFGIIFGIDMLNGFAFLYPSLPSINVRFLGDLTAWFTAPPWNATGWTPIGLFPFLAAIGLLMPTDLLFSCLFFFFLRKGMQVLAVQMGYNCSLFGGGGLVPAAPYFSEQSWGAFLALFCTALWSARPYLREVWRDIVHGGPARTDRVAPRLALIGLVGSLIGLGFFGMALGLPFLFVVGYIALFLAFSLAMTRLRAQLGAPTHEMAFMGPNQLFVDFHGTQGVTAPTLVTVVTTFHFMNRIHRTHPMPSQLEAMYLGSRTRLNAGGVFGALILATVVGSVIGHLTRIYIGYSQTPSNSANDTTAVITTFIHSPRAANPTAMLAVAAGFAFVLLLDLLRFNVLGFPLHPAGYALAMNFGLDYYWFGLLLAWIAKSATLRYSGLKGYEKLKLVAFGLILGEFVAEAIWAIFSMMHHNQATYTISINGKLNWQQ